MVVKYVTVCENEFHIHCSYVHFVLADLACCVQFKDVLVVDVVP